MASLSGGRAPVQIYPDMTVEFDSKGNYWLSFAVESPQTDVTLNLEVKVPFEAPVGQLNGCTELRLVEEVPGSPGMARYEAIVTIPPIRIPADKGVKTSTTRQYCEREIWKAGTSAGLALAYGCCDRPQISHILNERKPETTSKSIVIATRNGTATVGSVIQ